ncbi:MAG: chromate transporter [bacterium]|nr:chromate transporter [bacterium]
MLFLYLVLEFFKIGAFSFGGGFATLPYIFELADKTNWFDYTEVNQMITISQMTPRTTCM